MNMQVERNSVVTLDYSVTDPDGELVDAGQEPLVYLHGGYDDIFPKIEEALHGKKVGESVVVKMQPDDAFGEYDAELIQMESRKGFPKELEVGMQFEGVPEGGDDDDILIYRVTEIADDSTLNLRSAPNTSGEILLKLYKNQYFYVELLGAICHYFLLFFWLLKIL